MDEIKFDTNNYRKHTDKNKNLIKKSLKKCGAGRSIVIDSEGEIIAGNGVYEQAKELNIPVKVIESDGSELIAIKRTDLKTSDKKRKEMAAFDNSTADGVTWKFFNLGKDFDLNKVTEELGINVDLKEVNKEEKTEGKVKFTEELLEEHNYIVLYFDNKVDWLQAQTLLGLEQVAALDSKEGYKKQGVGRVLNGVKAIEKLKGEAAE